jgi:hypothetical protein
MKKSYVAPNIKLSINGSLEGVFASGTGGASDPQLTANLMGSGTPIFTLTPYCNNANKWMISVEKNNGYGDDE